MQMRQTELLIMQRIRISSVTRLELSGSRYSVSRALQWPGALGTYITALITVSVIKRTRICICSKQQNLVYKYQTRYWKQQPVRVA